MKHGSFGKEFRRIRPCNSFLAILFGLALSTLAHGQVHAEADAYPVEARQRFDRGLALYEAGDYLGALAEFQRAHELTRHPLVLYNVALVHAKLGNALAAVEAIEALRAQGWSTLGEAQQARLDRTYNEQSARIGTISLITNVPDAVIQVDNVDVPRASTARLRLDTGRHLITAFAPNFAPKSLAVNVIGGAHRDVNVELVPLEARLARVRLSSNVSDVEVRLAGTLVAELPVAGELILTPGSHQLEFTRLGYQTELRRIELGPSGSAALHVEMVPTPEGERSGGRLVLAVSEPNAVVEVDGVPQSNPAAGIRLPQGNHVVRVQRAGFFDVARQVHVDAGAAHTLEAKLLPTPDYWADYVASAQRTRTVAYVLGGSGALALAVSGGYLLWNQGQKRDAERAFDEHVERYERPGTCNATCMETSEILIEDLDAKRARDIYGWVGLGVGAAALGTGVLLYGLGDDPARYDPGAESDVFGGLSLTVGAAGLIASGRF